MAIATLALAAITFLSYESEKPSKLDILHVSENTVSTLQEDLPDYIFENQLRKMYPATWQFYSKLTTIKQDKVYSYYLYNPDIEKVRHKIFALTVE